MGFDFGMHVHRATVVPVKFIIQIRRLYFGINLGKRYWCKLAVHWRCRARYVGALHASVQDAATQRRIVMKLESLAHVVLKVRSLEKSIPFYRDVLGMKLVARY